MYYYLSNRKVQNPLLEFSANLLGVCVLIVSVRRGKETLAIPLYTILLKPEFGDLCDYHLVHRREAGEARA